MIVEIFFFGMITFYSHSEDGEMTALLLDVPNNYSTTDGHEFYVAGDGKTVEPHTPCLQLYDFLDEDAEEKRGLCDPTEEIKPLRRQRIKFAWAEDGEQRNKATALTRAPRTGNGNKPTSDDDVKALDWTINWWKLHQNPIFDLRSLEKMKPPDVISAHIQLTDGTIETCTLIKDEDEDNLLFGFRPLSPPRNWKGFQMLAETVRLTMTNANAKHLDIEMYGLDSRDRSVIPLGPRSGKCEVACPGKPDCREKCKIVCRDKCTIICEDDYATCQDKCDIACKLFIWNMPPKSTRSYTARHFEIQHELLEDPPQRRLVADRLKKGNNGWENENCKIGISKDLLTAVNNRPVCPMVQYP